MDGKKIKSPLGEIASPFAVHEGLFPDVQDAKFAIRGVLRAFFGTNSNGDEDFLFFKRIKVRFEENPEFDLDFDYRRRTIIFVMKEPQGQGAEALKAQVTKDTNMEYAIRASDGLGRTAMSIFLSLDEQGRRVLIETEKQKEAKSESGGE
jgi:hypothetical protein